MRVLVASHNYPRWPGDPAGAFVARLAHRVSRDGADVCAIVPHASGLGRAGTEDGVMVQRFRYAPARLERVAYSGHLHVAPLRHPLRTMTVPLFLAAFRHGIASARRSFRPDVVHAHWWFPSAWAAGVGRAPLIITCHGSDLALIDRRTMRPLASSILGRASVITTVSGFLRNRLLRHLPELASRTHVEPMPIDVELFELGRQVAKASPARLLFAGNLVASKGVDVLLRALAILRSGACPATLRIRGQGPEEPALRTLTRELALGDAVEFLPFAPQQLMPAEYGAATVTVLPTRSDAEGLGLTLVEALLAGSAVVGSGAGGIPEVVEDGVTGLLFRDGDHGHLAMQLERLLRDGDLRARLTAQGAARVRDRYDAAAVARRFRRHYDDAIQAAAR